MPLSAVVKDGPADYEAWANGDGGAPLGRELEIADLLSFMKRRGIRNTVWLTADVHYPANIHYHPDRATAFKDFDPFWEFISGPLHAGGFGPNPLDPACREPSARAGRAQGRRVAAEVAAFLAR